MQYVQILPGNRWRPKKATSLQVSVMYCFVLFIFAVCVLTVFRLINVDHLIHFSSLLLLQTPIIGSRRSPYPYILVPTN